MSAHKNILEQYRDPTNRKFRTFTAVQFQEVWKYFDKDGNGYIEDHELDHFLKLFIGSVVKDASELGEDNICPEATMSFVKNQILAAYDENEDGRIEIGELAQILPIEEEFLHLFQRTCPLPSSVEFMRVWRQFDPQSHGYINSGQLYEFLRSICRKTKNPYQPNEKTLKGYCQIILSMFDINKDGCLELSEMSRLLPVKQNYLYRPMLRRIDLLSQSSIDSMVHVYDQDNDGKLSPEELESFLKDLLDLTRQEYKMKDLQNYKRFIMVEWDSDKDGMIDRDELMELFKYQMRLVKIRKSDSFRRLKLGINMKETKV